MRATSFALLLALVCFASVPAAQPAAVTALVGATLIDGAGRPPVPDAVVVIEAGRITAAGPRASMTIPAGAQVIDVKGRWIVPGFIDTNVHLSLYGGVNDRYETLVRYSDRQRDIVLEAAQIQLARGVTTVRDSYGMLEPLVAVRDEIAAGRKTGARILAAGNIVGWGGPYSVSFSLIQERGLTLFQEQMNDAISQGAGEELVQMSLVDLGRAIRAYLDKGPDFLKYGGTAHFARPSFIGFSPEAQQVIVDETHKRGLVAETHATTPEGLRLSIDAGIDLIQHPEILSDRELPDAMVKTIVERQIICSMLVSTMTGDAWSKHLKDKEEVERKKAGDKAKTPARPLTTAEERQRDADLGIGLEVRRANAQKLIKAGAIVTVGTDSYWAAAAELSRAPKPENQDHGMGTIIAIEGLVELGMTPMQALVAGTANGARASRKADEIGTLAAGRRADLLVLSADPLVDIHNIRKLVTVMKDGRVIDRERLPEQRVLSPASQRPATTSGQ